MSKDKEKDHDLQLVTLERVGYHGKEINTMEIRIRKVTGEEEKKVTERLDTEADANVLSLKAVKNIGAIIQRRQLNSIKMGQKQVSFGIMAEAMKYWS